jgi:hypothetical protein
MNIKPGMSVREIAKEMSKAGVLEAGKSRRLLK